MFDATEEVLESNQVMRYTLTRDGIVLTYAEVLDLWQADAEFRRYYTQWLARSPFAAFRWETPALSTATLLRPFQFVLLNSPNFSTRKTDPDTYRSYFSTDDHDEGIVSFLSLGGDARLVVPSPRTGVHAYGHLAAFVRNAPVQQLDAMWRVIGNLVKAQVGDKPLWLNTAGGGVAWLHVRLDSRPKYYGHHPFKTV